MLTKYIQAALQQAKYKILDDGSYFGEVSNLPGVWADGDTLEACREELREVIEGWILIGLRHGKALPVLDGITLEVAEATS